MGVRIYGDDDAGVLKVNFQLIRLGAIAENHHDRLNATAAQIVDAGLDYGLGTKRKERFERAHALGSTGSEDKGSDFIGLWSLVFGLCYHYGVI